MRGLSRSGLIAAIAMAAVTVAAPHVEASPLGIDFTPTFTYTDNEWNMGYQFTVLNNVTVVGLGLFDGGSASNLGIPQTVGLWDSDGNLVIPAVTVDNTAYQQGLWAFTLITPLQLEAGKTYTVGAQSTGNGGPFAQFDTFTNDPNIGDITMVGYHLGGDFSQLVEPTEADGDFLGGNILLDVPEPMSLSLFGMALAGLGVLRRRKRRA